ncbi:MULTISPECIES: MCE family protein [Actinomadura]|uniref:MCE family protein n=1 Tax=Actinomadura miaoliensis TaxID=430685 RepID=A0ABP7UVS6_9ACTN
MPSPSRKKVIAGLRRLRRAAFVVTAGVAAVVLAGTALAAFDDDPGYTVTAYFRKAVGVHEGSDVRVLGLKVGAIRSVRPEPSRVRVDMRLDRTVLVPANAGALVIAPSVVADRYVQLTPVYTGGPRLADGAVIPVERTGTPMEIDQLYATVSKLATDLGPDGLNRDGALSDAIRTGAANLDGNGRAAGRTIEQLGRAAKTLNGSQRDLFATVDNLRRFTGMLRDNDAQVRQAERQLADVTGFLAADRADLAAALRLLAEALGKVKTFVEDNRALLKSNVGKLASITQVLVEQRRSLAEALDVQPLNVQNVLNAYDPQTGSLMGRANLNELSAGGGAGPPLPLPTVDGGGR